MTKTKEYKPIILIYGVGKAGYSVPIITGTEYLIIEHVSRTCLSTIRRVR